MRTTLQRDLPPPTRRALYTRLALASPISLVSTSPISVPRGGCASLTRAVPRYAAFYFRLGPEMIQQRRGYQSLFALFESWGASGAFLYVVFGLTSRYWNSWRFNRQVAGLDIRKLDRGQFTQHGRLIDKSFQMPREFQCMSAD